MRMKKSLCRVIVLLMITAFSPDRSGAADYSDLRHLARAVFDQALGSRAESTKLFVSQSESTSFASITWRDESVTIKVNPARVREESFNTWAFIFGHEMGHYIQDFPEIGCHRKELRNNAQLRQACRAREFVADELGAEIVLELGEFRGVKFNLHAYAQHLIEHHQYCGTYHGCWSDRAARLIKLNNVET